MACRSPTPASCPIVLDRKERGRELEPLQGLDQGLAGAWRWWWGRCCQWLTTVPQTASGLR